MSLFLSFKWFAFFHYEALTTAVLQRGEGEEMLSFLWCPWGVNVGGDVGNWPVRAAEYTGATYGSTSPISTDRICHIENISTASAIYWTDNSTLNVFSPTRTLSSSSGACKSMGCEPLEAKKVDCNLYNRRLFKM